MCLWPRDSIVPKRLPLQPQFCFVGSCSKQHCQTLFPTSSVHGHKETVGTFLRCTHERRSDGCLYGTINSLCFKMYLPRTRALFLSSFRAGGLRGRSRKRILLMKSFEKKRKNVCGFARLLRCTVAWISNCYAAWLFLPFFFSRLARSVPPLVS